MLFTYTAQWQMSVTTNHRPKLLKLLITKTWLHEHTDDSFIQLLSFTTAHDLPPQVINKLRKTHYQCNQHYQWYTEVRNHNIQTHKNIAPWISLLVSMTQAYTPSHNYRTTCNFYLTPWPKVTEPFRTYTMNAKFLWDFTRYFIKLWHVKYSKGLMFIVHLTS